MGIRFFSPRFSHSASARSWLFYYSFFRTATSSTHDQVGKWKTHIFFVLLPAFACFKRYLEGLSYFSSYVFSGVSRFQAAGTRRIRNKSGSLGFLGPGRGWKRFNQAGKNLTPTPLNFCHRIGWWENLQEPPINLMVKTMASCRFSLKPIQWFSRFL